MKMLNKLNRFPLIFLAVLAAPLLCSCVDEDDPYIAYYCTLSFVDSQGKDLLKELTQVHPVRVPNHLIEPNNKDTYEVWNSDYKISYSIKRGSISLGKIKTKSTPYTIDICTFIWFSDSDKLYKYQSPTSTLTFPLIFGNEEEHTITTYKDCHRLELDGQSYEPGSDGIFHIVINR